MAVVRELMEQFNLASATSEAFSSQNVPFGEQSRAIKRFKAF
jgi:hypothetical protein